MKYLKMLIYLFCVLFVSGCSQIFSQQSKQTITTHELRGSWAYTIDGTKSAFLLRGFWNNDGRLIFKFVKQFYDCEPVFKNYSIRNGQVKITFDLISYDQLSSKGKLEFILKGAEDNTLQGQIFEPGGKSETVTLKKHGEYMDTEPFEGTWSHSPKILGKERTHVFRCSKDSKGRLKFDFLKQYYSYEPIFTEHSIRDNQIEIKFKLTTYSTGYDSKYSIKYVLRAEGDFLVGKMHESWREPVDVILTPLREMIHGYWEESELIVEMGEG